MTGHHGPDATGPAAGPDTGHEMRDQTEPHNS